LEELVAKTPMVDTHEHLPDEEERLRGEKVACDDWGVLFSHYIDSDLASAGMPPGERDKLVARGVDPEEKWRSLAPFWPAVKNTGYGRAVRLSVKRLYDIDEIEAGSVARLQEAYERFRKPGIYRKALVDAAGIESCQVNYLWRPFRESRQPELLHQDLSILAMHMAPGAREVSGPAGRDVRDLGDWHGAIRWWFETYGPYAVAVKSQAAYARGLDYERVSADDAAPVFRKILAGEPVAREERKRLEDHLFWFCVEEATARGLPVKLHTGYYAGQNSMPLSRVAANPAEAADLCRKAPETTFVFMHIAYPRWQDLVAVAKHYTNAVIDMCWAWIVDPAAAKEFLKSCVAAAPSTKVLTFGGDYIPVECVVGHAAIARRGVARALAELVEEGWLGPEDALELVERLLRGNARRIFRLEEKTERLAKAPWIR
ncbi:MAG: amidohydrolase family protein, partial [Planctomycetota bacterium]